MQQDCSFSKQLIHKIVKNNFSVQKIDYLCIPETNRQQLPSSAADK